MLMYSISSYLTERKILDGISFAVPAGKSVAIVGTSGSGKVHHDNSLFSKIILHAKLSLENFSCCLLLEIGNGMEFPDLFLLFINHFANGFHIVN